MTYAVAFLGRYTCQEGRSSSESMSDNLNISMADRQLEIMERVVWRQLETHTTHSPLGSALGAHLQAEGAVCCSRKRLRVTGAVELELHPNRVGLWIRRRSRAT